MKRTLKSIAVLALSALAMVSCQKELLGPATQEGQEVEVSLDLTTPLMGTKAYADGNTVNVVHVHVYQQDAQGNLTYITPAAQGATTKTPSQDVAMSAGAATYSTRLVTGQTYTFVFWAENSSCSAYTYTPGTQTVTVSYANAAGNDESRDAFYAVLENVTITGAYSASVTLKRPFAQINFGASDYEAAKAAGIEVTGAAVKLTGIGNSINLLNGTVSGSEVVTFANADLTSDPNDPNATLTVAGVVYKYVAMDYVLVGNGDKTLSDVTLTLAARGTLSTTPEYTYTNVPLQGNYRTNIVGSLFTSPADINITVNPAFGNQDENIITGVANLDAANTAFENGATAVTVEEITSSDPEIIVLPATTAEVSLTLPAAPEGKTITIKYPDTASNVPATVNIKAVNAASLTIEAPQSHVELNGITVTTLTASTSSTTLVVGADVTVGTLTVKAGSAVIYGTVTTLVKEEGAGKIEWHVTDEASLKTALKYDGKIVVESDIAMAASAVINGGRTLEIDLNRHNISAPSKVLNISNAKVDFTGNGKIYESTDNQYGALVLAGSSVDVADYTVVNVGKNVTLAGWTGIFIAKDANGGYNNYGLVVNCKGTLENPGMDTHTTSGDAIYINGANKNTTGNIPKINLDGCRLKSKGLGIYAAGYAEWTLSNCEVKGDITAIEIRAGKMTIDGGTYTSNKDPFDVEPNGSGTTTEGAALGISQHTTNLPIEVVVKGGTFNGAYAIWEKDVQNEEARDQIKLTVNNGTFNGAIYSQNNPNAIIKGTYSDPSALNYLADDADVKIDVQQDVNSGFFTLPASAKAEIALNGKRVTFTAASESGHGSKIYGNLVISGSGYIGDPTHSTVGYLFDMYENSTLLVEGDATIESGLTCIQLSDNAHATVKGGKWIVDEWNNKYWTINKIDSSKDSAVVEVMGGEFYKFDPSNSATENPVQNWVPEGYTVTSENDWYKVTAE